MISINLVKTVQNYLKKAKHKLKAAKKPISINMSSDEEINMKRSTNSAKSNKASQGRRGRRTDEDKLDTYYRHQKLQAHTNEKCDTCMYTIGKYGDALVSVNRTIQKQIN